MGGLHPTRERRYGYYTLPILWGDRLVARFDSRFERVDGTLRILGFWPEVEALATDSAFAEALRAGMARFLAFLGAGAIDASAVAQARLRRALAAATTGPGPG